MIIISRRLVTLLGWFRGHSKSAIAVTVFPFIIVRSQEELFPWLLVHERIHIRQQIELLLIGALLLFVVETIYARCVLGLSKRESYLYFSLEQEAYRNQHDPNYLKNRKPFSVFYYIYNKRKFSHKDGIVTYL